MGLWTTAEGAVVTAVRLNPIEIFVYPGTSFIFALALTDFSLGLGTYANPESYSKLIVAFENLGASGPFDFDKFGASGALYFDYIFGFGSTTS